MKVEILKSRLVKLQEKHLDVVYQWRNSPDVRKNMYRSDYISSEEHLSWFERINVDPSKQYFLFELDDILCGVIGFVDINYSARSSSWAFYSGDTAKRGIGPLMEIAALNYAFNELKLKKLSCEVLEFNQSVIKLHKKHGFKEEGVFKKHYFRDGNFWDVHRLAIFDKDWLRCKEEVESKVKGPYSPGKTHCHPFKISESQITSFAQVTGDDNKIHLDDKVARDFGFERRISHGLLASAVFSKLFSTIFPGEGAIYLSQSLNFLEPIYPNEKLEAKLTVFSKIGRQISVKTTISHIDTGLLLASGEAELLLPDAAARY